MNALNAKLVTAPWHECSIETMPTYIQSFSITKGSAQSTVWQVALLAEQAFSRTFTKICRVVAVPYRTPKEITYNSPYNNTQADYS